MHTKINETPDIVGLTLNSAKEGEEVSVAFKGTFISDNIEFHDSIKQIYDLFLTDLIKPEECNNILIVRHLNKSADIYLNNFEMICSIRIKNKIKKGEPVYKKNIADIIKLKFPKIKITNKDQIMFLYRVGWKFGFHFNFSANTELKKQNVHLNLNELYTDLASMYRYLLFEKEYMILQNSKLFDNLIKDGWFPFIQLLDKDYLELSLIYQNKWYNKIDEWMSKFNYDEISSFTQYWWDNKIYNEKKEILESGIAAFLENTNKGFINCITNLYTQIEGILRIVYFSEFKKKPTFKQLNNFIRNKALAKYSTSGSLGFPSNFYEYIEKYIFKNFDLKTGEITLSRHTVSHGVAISSDFKKSKALQAVLLLDQMHFYLK